MGFNSEKAETHSPEEMFRKTLNCKSMKGLFRISALLMCMMFLFASCSATTNKGPTSSVGYVMTIPSVEAISFVPAEFSVWVFIPYGQVYYILTSNKEIVAACNSPPKEI